jgi:hypothetical protein
MYEDSSTKSDRLLDEAMGCLGMIHEAHSKLLILRAKVQKFRDENPNGPTEEFEKEVLRTTARIRADLNRYRRRLEDIHEELSDYGVVPKIQ